MTVRQMAATAKVWPYNTNVVLRN